MTSCRLMAIGIVLVMVLGVGACSATVPSTRPAATVRVTERDFYIAAPDRVPAGDIVLSVTNRGPEAHELIVVRKTGPQLPLRADGLTVDEEALAAATPGALEPGDAGSVRTLRVHLVPGHYVFLCNMAGHYMGGMDADVIAS
jgi:uncharacterized cupredoxin-like copper-binding protein